MFSPKVNFIGIGVQKAGTTWLSSILKEHPEIYIHPRKELHYFDKTKFTNSLYYNFLFRDAKGQKIIGEFTPSYILNKTTAKRIHNYNKKIKLLVILRDPTDRAVSQYKMEIGRKYIDKKISIMEAFKRNLFDMKKRGHYQKLINEYLEYFSRKQILFIDYDHIATRPEKVLETVYSFLNVSKIKSSSNVIKKRIRHKKDLSVEIKIAENEIKFIRDYYEKLEDFKKFFL
tara:strand:+ start:490 stop:1179 length:690 start_codon:yes stop_codon:yes gene_type:complete